jgi:hypothetical protein
MAAVARFDVQPGKESAAWEMEKLRNGDAVATTAPRRACKRAPPVGFNGEGHAAPKDRQPRREASWRC